jgi:hypothetical protein
MIIKLRNDLKWALAFLNWVFLLCTSYVFGLLLSTLFYEIELLIKKRKSALAQMSLYPLIKNGS